MNSNEKPVNQERKSIKPERIVEGFSLTPVSGVSSTDGIINMVVEHRGGISTPIIDYFRYPDGRICVETQNTVYVLNSINSEFVKTNQAVLKVLKDAKVRDLETKETLPQEKDFQIKGTLQVWGLSKGLTSSVIGRSVSYEGGANTSPIKRFWKCASGNVVIETQTSFYLLGTPNMGFAVKHTELMRQLGLM